MRLVSVFSQYRVHNHGVSHELTTSHTWRAHNYCVSPMLLIVTLLIAQSYHALALRSVCLHSGVFVLKCHFFVTTAPIDTKLTEVLDMVVTHEISPSYDAAFRRSLERDKKKTLKQGRREGGQRGELPRAPRQQRGPAIYGNDFLPPRVPRAKADNSNFNFSQKYCVTT